MPPLGIGGVVQISDGSTIPLPDALNSITHGIQRLQATKSDLQENMKTLHKYILTVFCFFCRHLWMQHKQKKQQLSTSMQYLHRKTHEKIKNLTQFAFQYGAKPHIIRELQHLKFIQLYFSLNTTQIQHNSHSAFLRQIVSVYYVFDRLVHKLDDKIKEKIDGVTAQILNLQQQYEIQSKSVVAESTGAGGSVASINNNLKELKMEVDGDSDISDGGDSGDSGDSGEVHKNKNVITDAEVRTLHQLIDESLQKNPRVRVAALEQLAALLPQQMDTNVQEHTQIQTQIQTQTQGVTNQLLILQPIATSGLVAHQVIVLPQNTCDYERKMSGYKHGGSSGGGGGGGTQYYHKQSGGNYNGSATTSAAAAAAYQTSSSCNGSGGSGGYGGNNGGGHGHGPINNPFGVHSQHIYEQYNINNNNNNNNNNKQQKQNNYQQQQQNNYNQQPQHVRQGNMNMNMKQNVNNMNMHMHNYGQDVNPSAFSSVNNTQNCNYVHNGLNGLNGYMGPRRPPPTIPPPTIPPPTIPPPPPPPPIPIHIPVQNQYMHNNNNNYCVPRVHVPPIPIPKTTNNNQFQINHNNHNYNHIVPPNCNCKCAFAPPQCQSLNALCTVNAFDNYTNNNVYKLNNNNNPTQHINNTQFDSFTPHKFYHSAGYSSNCSLSSNSNDNIQSDITHNIPIKQSPSACAQPFILSPISSHNNSPIIDFHHNYDSSMNLLPPAIINIDNKYDLKINGNSTDTSADTTTCTTTVTPPSFAGLPIINIKKDIKLPVADAYEHKVNKLGSDEDPTSQTNSNGKLKRFQCNICNAFWFETSAALRMHVNTHIIMQRTTKRQSDDPNRPWQCEVCKRKFAEKCTLKRHVRIHTNEKPWKCQFCNKAFNQSCSLQAHIRIHTGERPFPCIFCEKRFRQSTHRRQHMKRVHKQQWETLQLHNKTKKNLKAKKAIHV